MSNGEPHAAILDGGLRRVQPVRARLSATPRPSATQSANHALIATRVDRIMTLIAANRLHDAREACADLVFGFQPLIVARPELFERVVAALRRCEGHQLLRRLAMATDRDFA
jgi:hypothetical protein